MIYIDKLFIYYIFVYNITQKLLIEIRGTMETTLNSLKEIFNLQYSFVNISSIYIINSILKDLNINNFVVNMLKDSNSDGLIKRGITILMSIINGLIFNTLYGVDSETLLCSAMLSIVFYDYFVKLIIKKLEK